MKSKNPKLAKKLTVVGKIINNLFLKFLHHSPSFEWCRCIYPWLVKTKWEYHGWQRTQVQRQLIMARLLVLTRTLQLEVQLHTLIYCTKVESSTTSTLVHWNPTQFTTTAAAPVRDPSSVSKPLPPPSLSHLQWQVTSSVVGLLLMFIICFFFKCR